MEASQQLTDNHSERLPSASAFRLRRVAFMRSCQARAPFPGVQGPVTTGFPSAPTSQGRAAAELVKS